MTACSPRSSSPSEARSSPPSSTPKPLTKCSLPSARPPPRSLNPLRSWCSVRRLRRILPVVLLVAFTLSAHAQQTLRIAAAADLQPLLPGILAQFTAQTGIQTSASYKSSATLATSIINGAPFDLFLAADLSSPQKVISAGLAEESQPVPYARGTLVLWTRNDTPFTRLSIDSLRDPALKTVAIANPQHAPYGRAAQDAL